MEVPTAPAERLRFHDYGSIYERPGLYEYLFYDLLECRSPERGVGLLAFNIKEEFLDARYTLGFSELMRRMLNDGVARLDASLRYRHRNSAAGAPIFNTAMVAAKLKEIPASMLVDEQ